MLATSAWSWCGHSTFKILTSAAPAGRDDSNRHKCHYLWKQTTDKTLIKPIHTFHCTESVVSRSGKRLQKNTSPQMNRLYMRVLLASLKSRNTGLLAGQRTRCFEIKLCYFYIIELHMPKLWISYWNHSSSSSYAAKNTSSGETTGVAAAFVWAAGSTELPRWKGWHVLQDFCIAKTWTNLVDVQTQLRSITVTRRQPKQQRA